MMQSADDPGVVTARRLLRLLRKSGALEREPTGIELRRILGTPTVRDALLVTIEHALHGEHQLCREIVQRCDIDDRPTDVVAAELGMSARSFFRYRQRALEAIAATIQRTLVARGALLRGTSRAAQLTMLGNFLLGQQSGDSTAAALRSFGAALEADPGAVDAYVGLALAHVRSVTCLYRPPFEAYARASSAAKRALQRAPRAAGALGAAAIVTLRRTGDVVTTRQLVNDAMSLDACDPVAVQALGDLAMSEGRLEDADAAAQTGLEIEPASLARRFRVLTIAGLRGQFTFVAAQCRTLLEGDPSSIAFRLHLVDALIGLHRPAEAIAAAGDVETMTFPYLLASIVVAYADLNLQADARRIADRFQTLPTTAFIHAGVRAQVEDLDGTLTLLTRAIAEEPRLRQIATFDPIFERVRDRPAFRRLTGAR
jgi:hypothetical protein